MPEPLQASLSRIGAGLLILLLTLTGCSTEGEPVYTTQFSALDSTIDLSIVGQPREQAKQLAMEVEDEFQTLDQLVQIDAPGELAVINAQLESGEAFMAPPELLTLLAQSRLLSDQSDNLFNPAGGRLLRVWGLHQPQPKFRPPPPDHAVSALVEADPRLSDIRIEGDELQCQNPNLQLDFDAIITGYAIDKGIAILRGQGVESALINASGNIRAIGDRSGRTWRIPLRSAGGSGVLGTLNVRGDVSIFTAADYQRSYLHQGNLYHHILDWRDGYPADQLRLVTVMHPGSAAVADAAAHAIMVAGLDRWQEIADRMGIQEVLMIDQQGRLHMTPGMAEQIQLFDEDEEILISGIKKGDTAGG